jgi:hypothetical protein
VRLGPRNPETGWLAAVADTWDIDKREKTWGVTVLTVEVTRV